MESASNIKRNQKHSKISRLQKNTWTKSKQNQYFSKWEEEVSHHPDSVYNSFRNEKYELISEEFNLIKKISENGINRIELTQKEFKLKEIFDPKSYFSRDKSIIKKS